MPSRKRYSGSCHAGDEAVLDSDVCRAPHVYAGRRGAVLRAVPNDGMPLTAILASTRISLTEFSFCIIELFVLRIVRTENTDPTSPQGSAGGQYEGGPDHVFTLGDKVTPPNLSPPE
jgi:hypothetical protein